MSAKRLAKGVVAYDPELNVRTVRPSELRKAGWPNSLLKLFELPVSTSKIDDDTPTEYRKYR